jgi:murein DD-endopeptidase MepM/ murein hydrolase activator NlpD
MRFAEIYDNWIAKLLKKKSHDGIDYACPVGTKVYTSSISGEHIVRIGQDHDGLYYIVSYLLTENNNVFFLLYRHLQNVSVAVGDFVVDRQIAEVGPYSNGSHCHFGVYGAIDPARYLSV